MPSSVQETQNKEIMITKHRWILEAAVIAALTLSGCSRTESTASENVENVEDVATEVVTDQSTLGSTGVDAAEKKVISKVQVIRDDKEFFEKVCEIDPEKGMRFKGELPALVDFYADWCGPCQQISPFLVEFAEKYAGEIIIYKVNIDKHPDLASAFNVRNIPNLLFFKPGQKPTQAVGAMPKSDLEKAIQELLLN